MRLTTLVLFVVLISLFGATGCRRERPELCGHSDHRVTVSVYRHSESSLAERSPRTTQHRELLRALLRRSLSVGIKIGLAMLLSELDYGEGFQGEAFERIAVSAGVLTADELLKLIFEDEKK